MNYQERIQKIQAKIKSIKNMLGETNEMLAFPKDPQMSLDDFIGG